jgi:hypothetical protein
LPVYFLPYDYRQDKADKKFSCTGTNRSAKEGNPLKGTS